MSRKSINPIVQEINQILRSLEAGSRRIPELVEQANAELPTGLKLSLEDFHVSLPSAPRPVAESDSGDLEWKHGAWARCTTDCLSYFTKGDVYPVMVCDQMDEDDFYTVDEDGDVCTRHRSEFELVRSPNN